RSRVRPSGSRHTGPCRSRCARSGARQPLARAAIHGHRRREGDRSMSADFVLYRRMRGVFWGVLVALVIGLPALVVIGVTTPANAEWADASYAREIGGPQNVFELGFVLASFAATFAAVMLGATAGSVDHQRGVLRDLVLTGRPRVVI